MDDAKKITKITENTSKTHGVGTSHKHNISTLEHSTTHTGSTARDIALSTATKASTPGTTYTV